MKNLKSLGFTFERNLSPQVQATFKEATGLAFPESYLTFLTYSETDQMPLSFKFNDAESGEEWDGGINEFLHLSADQASLLDLASSMVKRDAEQFFPIGSDVGGNVLYLNLSKAGVPVVDVSYEDVSSEVASSFELFIEKLFVEED